MDVKHHVYLLTLNLFDGSKDCSAKVIQSSQPQDCITLAERRQYNVLAERRLYNVLAERRLYL